VSRRTIVLALSAILALIIGTGVALAANLALSGSNFEIDSDANLKLDGAAPAIDWATVNEVRKADTASGQQDESFGNGSKEDTANPAVVDGGIPPNKSDLKFFGLYQEGSTSSGFLNLFWSRVQDPSGTTNMDFELNQNKCQHVDNDNNPATPSFNDDGNPNAVDTPVAGSTCAGNGITPLRKGDGTGPLPDDILIQYDLSNGGVNPTISFRTWTGNQWSGLQTLAGNAVGSINTASIPAGESDGLGAQDPRTFGEAHVRLSALLGNSSNCVAFGSAYLKSRSSDTFNSALKDFVPPESVDISNCGKVQITKTDDATPAAALNGAEFTLYKDLAPVGGARNDGGVTDPITNPVLKCTTAGTGTDAGKCTINAVPFGDYWVVETVTPAGYATAPEQHATVSAANPTVSLTFVDVRDRGAILVTKLRKHAASGPGDHPQSGVDFTVNGVTQTTGNDGKTCFDGLLAGSYSVHETTPAGYHGEADKTVEVNNAATCAATPYAGETVTFHNTPLTDLTVSVDSKVDGGTSSTITCGTENTTTGTNGDGSLTRSNLEPGTYNCTVVIDP
jgi:uncharacterized surface anchored protein